MIKLFVRKIGDTSRCVFAGSDRLFTGNTYDVEVAAPEFYADDESVAQVSLSRAIAGSGIPTVLASSGLVPDPLRRGLRRGVFPVSSSSFALEGSGEHTFEVTLGGDTVVRVPVMVEYTGHVGGSSRPASSSSSWTVVEGSSVPPDGHIYIQDMTQSVYRVSSGTGRIVLHPVVSGVETYDAPFEAYVKFTSDSSWSPVAAPELGSGAPIIWERVDSFSLGSSEWMLHLMSVSGTWTASLIASVASPVGVEIDPDDAAVVSVEVNS